MKTTVSTLQQISRSFLVCLSCGILHHVGAATVIHTTNASDGVTGYHYGGSFGSWQIVRDDGVVESAYYTTPA